MSELNQSIQTLVTPQDLKLIIQNEKETRTLISEYIKTQLVESVDFGKIHVVSKAKCPEPWKCKVQSHFSKPSLFKAGTEKFVNLFKLRPTFKRDDETWEMGGKKVGLYCYVCFLISRNGDVVAEGRGSCHLSEKSSDNEAIKLAQKRAQTDAVLRHGALSDVFTQDLEDLPVSHFENKELPVNNAKPPVHNQPTNTAVKNNQSKPPSAVQISAIERLKKEVGITDEGLEVEAQKRKFSSHDLTGGWEGTASKLISLLKELKENTSNSLPTIDHSEGTWDDVVQTAIDSVPFNQ